MNKIVFTIVHSIDDIASATWHDGDQNSYERTAKMIEGRGLTKSIALIGRRDKYDTVTPCYAVKVWSGSHDFHSSIHVVSRPHMVLAKFLTDAYKNHTPEDNYLRPFIKELPDDFSKAAHSLISLECGIGLPVGDMKLHFAINEVNAVLGSLGVSIADWTFVPLEDAYHIIESTYAANKLGTKS